MSKYFCRHKWCGRLGIKCYDWTTLHYVISFVLLLTAVASLLLYLLHQVRTIAL